MSVRKPKKNKSWEVDVYINGRRVRKAGFSTKAEASAHERKILNLRDSGFMFDSKGNKAPLKYFFEDWIAIKRMINKPKTIENVEVAWSAWISPRFGEIAIKNITTASIRQWIANLKLKNGESASRETCNRAFNVLSQILDHAVESNAVVANPARALTHTKQRFLPATSTKEPKAFTPDEVLLVIDEIPEYALFTMFQAATGLRQSEAVALRIKDLNFETNRIEINKSITIVRGKLIEGTTKSNKSRPVFIPDFLKESLLILKSQKSKEDYLFTTPNGNVINMNNFRKRVWNPMITKLGLTGYKPHSLRKTAASIASSQGATLDAIRNLAGHSNSSVTAKHYIASYPQDQVDAQNKINKAFRKALLKSDSNKIQEGIETS
jgi:integrase